MKTSISPSHSAAPSVDGKVYQQRRHQWKRSRSSQWWNIPSCHALSIRTRRRNSGNGDSKRCIDHMSHLMSLFGCVYRSNYLLYFPVSSVQWMYDWIQRHLITFLIRLFCLDTIHITIYRRKWAETMWQMSRNHHSLTHTMHTHYKEIPSQGKWKPIRMDLCQQTWHCPDRKHEHALGSLDLKLESLG